MGGIYLLDGIRVVDFTQYLPGPFATLRLGDWGAEVIKVEPLQGDPVRAMDFGGDTASVFAANNRNKKSITLNLKKPEAQQIALELIQHADVVIESFRPRVMEKFGLDYEHAKALNKKIIYLSLTGLGKGNTMATLGSHDLNYLALSGFLTQWRSPSGAPIQPSITLADLIGGMAASEAILAALYQREKTGKGVYIDLAITDAVFSMMTTHAMVSYTTGNHHGVSGLDGSSTNYKIYETKDHRYMSLGALEKKFWRNFCEAVHHADWVEAYPHQLSIDGPLFGQVKELFLERTQSEWAKIGEMADCCLFPVRNIDEALRSPHAQERHLVQQINGKPYVLTHFGSTTNEEKVDVTLGKHTKEILNDLGKSDAQIEEWRKLGSIKK